MRPGDINYDEKFKQRVIKESESGLSPTEIAKKFGISRTSVYRWLSRRDDLSRKQVSGRPMSLTQDEINQFLAYMQHGALNFGFESDLWTGPRIKLLVKKKLNKNLHRATIHRMLTESHYSFKKAEVRWAEASKKSQVEWISNIIPEIKSWVKKNKAVLYFMDESIIQLTPCQGKTWSPVGQTQIIKRTSKRGKVCAISALSASQNLLFSLQKENFNGASVVEFLKQIKRKHPNRKIAIVMDNAACHKSKQVRDFLNSSQITAYYLPPYSPEFNPDEKVWNHLKSCELLAHHETTLDGLQKLASRKMHSMARRPKLLRGLFMRCEIAKYFTQNVP